VFNAAIGNSMRQGVFHLSDNGTSEFIKEKQEKVIAPVIDIKSVLDDLSDSKIGCLKINIEGGEYELMERLNEVNYNSRIKCFLIQFHQQPSDYLKRYENIVRDLSKTHSRVWSYDMVWEKWIIK
jgi:FkbM family methyltransferase